MNQSLCAAIYLATWVFFIGTVLRHEGVDTLVVLSARVMRDSRTALRLAPSTLNIVLLRVLGGWLLLGAALKGLVLFHGGSVPGSIWGFAADAALGLGLGAAVYAAVLARRYRHQNADSDSRARSLVNATP